MASCDEGTKFFKEKVQHNDFYRSEDIEKLITEVENTFAICLEGGDKAKAMKKLRVPPLGGKVGKSLIYINTISSNDISTPNPLCSLKSMVLYIFIYIYIYIYCFDLGHAVK